MDRFLEPVRFSPTIPLNGETLFEYPSPRKEKGDGSVKSRKCIPSVIPAKTVVRRAVRQAHGPEQSRSEIQYYRTLTNSWTPFISGVTTSYEIIKGGSYKKSDEVAMWFDESVARSLKTFILQPKYLGNAKPKELP